MLIKSISDFRAAMRDGQYAWPGWYPRYFVTSDGGALSFKTAKAERRNILEALASGDTWSGWHVYGVDINWEDPDLYDDHTGERIPSAYAEDDADDADDGAQSVTTHENSTDWGE